MSSEANTTSPVNFWGDMPEEEYYKSQGVRNTKSYFETPHGKLFTQSFLPLDGEIKGTVYMTHGYGSDTSWMFQKICISYSTWGYAVFAADLLGHGRSEGIRCYMGDLDKVAAASLSFFKHVRTSDEYKDLPAFLFGESMGGLATMLMYFQSEPDLWTGVIFSAPLFVFPEDMRPSSVHLFAFGLLFGLADTWAAMPDNKMVGKAIRDPEKLKIIASNPNRYTGKPRVGTMREFVNKTQYVQENFGKVTIPFLTVHGTADGVTCPTSSKLLYEKASSVEGWVVSVASVGDSRCILEPAEGGVYYLSADHRLEINEEERDRVTQSGGEVGRLNTGGGTEIGPLRCWPGGLCLSRSIGDLDVGEYIVPVPYVKQVKLSSAGGRLIISSDGVWDAISAEEALECCRGLPPESSAEHIVKEAVGKKGLRDDTTCIVVDILPLEKPAAPLPPPKKQGKGMLKSMFKRKSSDSSSNIEKEYAEPDVVEELFEEGSAMLSERLDTKYPLCNMFKLFMCAVCQVEVKPGEGVSIHAGSSNCRKLRPWDGPFLCASCQEKKDAMEGKGSSGGRHSSESD